MAKQSGLGDNCYIDQYDMSGDIGSLGTIATPLTTQEVTGISKFGVERIGLLHDGTIAFNSFFNPDTTSGAEGAHAVLKTLPTTDRLVTYCRGTTQGSPAASLASKQINYDGTRGQDGSFTFAVSAQGNSVAGALDGLAWGVLLTAGKRTDTTATSPATGLDLAASPTSFSFGWSAYLHVFAFTGTSVTITLQDSADNSAFTSLTGGAFGVVSARGAQRLASASTTATVRRYVRVITAGTFSNVVFAVNFVRYETAAS
jgi:hypothetical protein